MIASTPTTPKNAKRTDVVGAALNRAALTPHQQTLALVAFFGVVGVLAIFLGSSQRIRRA